MRICYSLLPLMFLKLCSLFSVPRVLIGNIYYLLFLVCDVLIHSAWGYSCMR